MAREHTVTKLSKSILEMKFMKKTKEKVEKELADTEGSEMYSQEITEQMKKSGGKCFIIEPSFATCEDLINGRLSFRGMNPEIERLMELEKSEVIVENKNEKDVTDAEMAAFYNPLVKTISKKFNKKNKDVTTRKEVDEPPSKRTQEDKGWKKNKKIKSNKQGTDSPSVQHWDKKCKFMKPRDD